MIDDKNVGIIVTCRVKSKRLPDKCLEEIHGKKTIEILLDHIINDKYQTILAIPDNENDDILKIIGDEKGIEVYRGNDDSPLHRLLAVANAYGFDNIVRITADDIFIDQHLLKNQIQFHLNGNNDYTYMKRCPDGIAGEIIKVSALKKAVEFVGDRNIEHVSYFLKKSGYKIKEYYPPYEYQYSFRCTLDYPEDLQLIKLLYSSIPEPFGTLDIIHFLRKHKHFCQINHLPKVTIYICNYNYDEYIIDCIDSVMNQSFSDYELIILDDNSTDNSIDLITKYYTKLSYVNQNKVKVLMNDENIGLPSSCNKVLDIARGKYIIRIDSDDILKNNAIETMVNEIESNNVNGVLSGYDKIDKDGNIIEIIADNHWHPGCCLLSRWCVNEIKYKDNVPYFEGAIFFQKFNELYNVKFIKDSLWQYRQHDKQKSSEQNREDRRKFKKDNNISLNQGSQTTV